MRKWIAVLAFCLPVLTMAQKQKVEVVKDTLVLADGQPYEKMEKEGGAFPGRSSASLKTWQVKMKS